MPYIEAEALQQARRVDLLSWLQANEPWNLVKISGNNYCTKEHDSLKISNYCKDHSLIYESRPYHNVIFVGYDKDGIARYAATRGTLSSYKGEVAGSDKHFSFSIQPYINRLRILTES